MPESDPSAIYRILDAASNRAGEGLRTLEEYARFVLDDAALTSELKSIRHQATSSLVRFDRSRRLRSRNAEGDVGTTISRPSEYVRQTSMDVLAAASERVQQSFRVLEEYGKLIDADMASTIEQLRYQCYTASAELELAAALCERRARLQSAQLYVLMDSGDSDSQFVETLTALMNGPVDIVQLRDQKCDDRTLLRRARLGTDLARQYQKLFIMNDRADLAVAADTDGLHVGQDELPAIDARKLLGPEKIIGISTHSIEQARQAVADGADYIGCGPVFAGQTKSFDSYVGTELLTDVAAEIDLPAFAIGGIDHSNVGLVIEAGCKRVAVAGAIRDAAEPGEAADRLKTLLTSTCSGQPTGDASNGETSQPAR